MSNGLGSQGQLPESEAASAAPSVNGPSNASVPSAPPIRKPPPPPPPPVWRPPPSLPVSTDPWTRPRTSGLAVASLVLGILWLFWLGSIAAVILGHAANHQIRNSRSRLAGAGLATAGLVLGYSGLVTLTIYLAIYVAAKN